MPGIRHDSKAWLLRGISALPGHLSLAGGWLSLRLLGSGSAWDWQLDKLARLAADADLIEQLLNGQRPLVFRQQLQTLAIRWPWYYFKGGMVITTARSRWRISFGPPVDNAGNRSLAGVIDHWNTIIDMRQTGQHWLQAIERATEPLA